MGYAQATAGVTSTGPLSALAFSTPICAQYSVQVSGGGTGTVSVEISVDGVNFVSSGISASVGVLAGGPSPQNLKPLAAIRANVTAVTGSIDVAIAAAPLNSE